MASDDDGDKTEEPSAKKLRDAREKGQVAKSKDLTSTAGLVVWLVLGCLAVGWAGERLAALMEAMLAATGQPFAQAAASLSAQALGALLALCSAVLAPAVAVGVLVEFLQVGPVFAVEKLQLKFESLNPAEGLQRIFSIDNLIEVAKALLKTGALLFIGWQCGRHMLAPLIGLVWAQRPQVIGSALWAVAQPVLNWTVTVFVLLSILDARHQVWSFMKKMRMSLDEVKKEAKEQEGDPSIKATRKQLGEEWIREATDAARRAHALIVNPTHIAIAVHYDREACSVPVLAAKGENRVARAMREAAEAAGVPILRNVPLARDLMVRGEVGHLVPADLFEVIAQVILWAREVRDELACARAGPGDSTPAGRPTDAGQRCQAPGEDMTLRGPLW